MEANAAGATITRKQNTGRAICARGRYCLEELLVVVDVGVSR